MDIKNLEEAPQYKDKTIALIEKQFGYTKDNHFEIDFYPLINPNNLKNCYILLDQDEVIAHIGCREVAFNLGDLHPVNMFGGIAVSEEHQGQGHFKKLFEYVLERHSDVAMSFLWSDKLDLYEKFDFYPCGDLNQYTQDVLGTKGFSITETSFDKLPGEDFQQLQQIYQLSEEIRLNRSADEWNQLKNITSSQLYLIHRNDVLINYFVKNKGQDLQEIIHEYGYIDLEQLKLMLNYGNVWTTFKCEDIPFQQLYATVAKIQDPKKFKAMIEAFFNVKFVSLQGSEITVQIGDEEFTLSQKDFLPGFLGPNTFQEVDSEPLFISGLDSI